MLPFKKKKKTAGEKQSRLGKLSQTGLSPINADHIEKQICRDGGNRAVIKKTLKQSHPAFILIQTLISVKAFLKHDVDRVHYVCFIWGVMLLRVLPCWVLG